MNGGSIQYEPYETDNNLPVTQAQGGSGPGSFPESYGADGQEYNYNGDAGYSQAGSTSSQNDGDDYSAANINFVYANEKRFSDFHSVFRSVPDEEKLIEGTDTHSITQHFQENPHRSTTPHPISLNHPPIVRWIIQPWPAERIKIEMVDLLFAL